MIAGLMKMSAVAETSFVETTRKPAGATAKPAAPRKRAPAKPAPAEPVAPPEASARPRVARGRRRLAAVGIVALVAVSAGVAFALTRGDDAPQAGAAAAVSAEALASFASSHDGPVYWLGPMAARKLELTSNSAGTFVRYLPLDASIGNSSRAVTVGTYPMRNAYSTAAGRAKAAQMTSRKAAGGGLAVWSTRRPTSVYLAFPGISQLVEVYSPDAGEARRLALSGRIRPVS
jgi:hypothetical protein